MGHAPAQPGPDPSTRLWQRITNGESRISIDACRAAQTAWTFGDHAFVCHGRRLEEPPAFFFPPSSPFGSYRTQGSAQKQDTHNNTTSVKNDTNPDHSLQWTRGGVAESESTISSYGFTLAGNQ
jgi:hypothetical protein